MNRLLSACAALLALVLAAACAGVAWKLMAVLDAARRASAAVESAVRTHERVTAQTPEIVRSVAVQWAAELSRAAGREGDRTRATLSQAVETADRRLGSIQGDARAAAEAVNQSAAEIAKVRSDLKPVLASAGSLAARIDTAIAPHLDCRSNGNCWPAGVTASLGGFKVLMGEGAQAARRIDAALPHFLEVSYDMAAQSRAVATNVNRLTKPRWYDRLLGYGLNGVVMYRNLNPATNLTLKSAEISSRPVPLVTAR